MRQSCLVVFVFVVLGFLLALDWPMVLGGFKLVLGLH